MLLLLRAAAAAHNISTEAERSTAYCFFLIRLRYYYCCFLLSILLLLLLLRRDMHFHFLFEVLLLPIIFLVGCSDPAAGACAAYNVSTKPERCTDYRFFHLRCCPLYCDASDAYCCCCSWLLLFLSFRLRCFGYDC